MNYQNIEDRLVKHFVNEEISLPRVMEIIKEEFSKNTLIQVKHPVHYNSHPSGVECIEVVHDWDYCLANAAKYQWRKGLKDGQPSEKEDMKALEYLEFRVKYAPYLGKQLTLEDVRAMIDEKIELILLRKRDKQLTSKE